jgi:hypothetical protein
LPRRNSCQAENKFFKEIISSKICSIKILLVIPPPDGISLPIIHKIDLLYKNIYQAGKNAPKRDRFGILTKIEEYCLSCFCLSIEAALSAKNEKLPILKKVRLNLEILKRLIRITNELGAIDFQKYIFLQKQLEEISKMASGWIKYLEL